MNKVKLRAEFKSIFNSWAGDIKTPKPLVATAESKICNHLKSYISERSLVCCAFNAIWGEPDLSGLVEPFAEKVTWIYPLVADQELHLWEPKSQTDFVVGAFGIKEPDIKQSELVFPEKVDLFLVPGLSFDKSGGRLGRGKGYYDRVLKEFNGVKIGVTFQSQVSGKLLPMESHDVNMDYLATELGVSQVS